MTHAVVVNHIDEQVVRGKRLGRHVWHDSRSRAYAFTLPVTLKTALHERMIPILDQGNKGSCVGNAVVGACGTIPIWPGLPVGHPTLNESEALAIYSV